MARRKQGTDKGEDKARGTLEEPWSSAPQRNPRYVLYCYNHDADRQYIVNSYALYAIRKIFDAIVGDNEIEPSPLDERTMTFGNVDIKSDQMKAILDHHYTKAEEEWELGMPYPQQIDSFLHGPRMSRRLQTDDAPPTAPGTPKPAPERRAAPKIDRSNLITVQSIAEDIGMDPRDARAALRKAKVEKPAAGWLGDEIWAKGIREVLGKAAKNLKKKGKDK